MMPRESDWLFEASKYWAENAERIMRDNRRASKENGMLKESDRAKFVSAYQRAQTRNAGFPPGAEVLWENMIYGGLVEPAPLEPGDYEVFFGNRARGVERWDGNSWHFWSTDYEKWIPCPGPARVGRRLPDET